MTMTKLIQQQVVIRKTRSRQYQCLAIQPETRHITGGKFYIHSLLDLPCQVETVMQFVLNWFACIDLNYK